MAGRLDGRRGERVRCWLASKNRDELERLLLCVQAIRKRTTGGPAAELVGAK